MRFGLALGGGGARGSVHIGVIVELNRLGIRPDLITGTSIGGLVGALAASGLAPQQMKELFDQFGFRSLYTFPTGGVPAITKPDKFHVMLEAMIGRPTFADLQIPLALVATNLVTHHEVVLDKGDLTTAINATMAFPFLLPPVQREGLTLVDGGLINNVPFDVARARGATYVMAVDLGNSDPYGSLIRENQNPKNLFERALSATKKRPLFQIATAVTDIVTNRAVRARLAISAPDILLRPTVGTIGLLDFHTLEEGIEIGRKAIQGIEKQLEELIEKIEKSKAES